MFGMNTLDSFIYNNSQVTNICCKILYSENLYLYKIYIVNNKHKFTKHSFDLYLILKCKQKFKKFSYKNITLCNFLLFYFCT